MSGILVHVLVLVKLVIIIALLSQLPRLSPRVEHLHGGVGGPVIITPAAHPDPRVETGQARYYRIINTITPCLTW